MNGTLYLQKIALNEGRLKLKENQVMAEHGIETLDVEEAE